MEIAAPAAPIVGSLDPVASQVTTQNAEETKVAPQAETPAGEQTASDEAHQTPEGEDDQPKQTWKEKRQERNRQRWQEYKAGRESLVNRLATLEAEVKRGREMRPPDFSQIQDPQEEMAQRTAWHVRQTLAAEKEQGLQQERQTAAVEQEKRLQAAWFEALDEAKERIPGFEKALDPANNKVHVRAMPFLVESEKAGDIVYWLSQNKAEADALFDAFERGSPKALIELGKIEARLSKPTPKTLSTAPKPAQVITGGVNPLQFDATRASVDDFAQQFRKSGLIR